MKKGIAVTQLILLILGIIVLAVIVYLVYVNFISSSSTFDNEKCRARALSICTACQVSGKKVNECVFPDVTKTDNWVNKCGGNTDSGGPCNFDASSDCRKDGRVECKNLGVNLPT